MNITLTEKGKILAGKTREQQTQAKKLERPIQKSHMVEYTLRKRRKIIGTMWIDESRYFKKNEKAA